MMSVLIFPKKIMASNSVITKSIPLIIAKTEAGTIVKAMYIKNEDKKSNEAGIAYQNGLIFVVLL